MKNRRRVACVWIDAGRAGKLVRDERYTGSGVKDSDKDVSTNGEFVQRQAWQEQDALHRLARWANRFSPLVGIVGSSKGGASDGVQWKQELQRKLRKQKGKHQRKCYAHPVDARLDAWKTEVIWIDITDVRRFFGSEEKLALRIYQEFREELKKNYRRVDLEWKDGTVAFHQRGRNPRTVKATAGRQEKGQGLVVRVAVAGTVGASWAACLTLREGVRLLPSHRASVWEVLRQLPVGCLRLSDETLDLLHRLGIHSLEQLLDLPRDAVVQRLGERVAHRCDQLLEDVDEPLQILHPQQRYVASQLLPGRIGGPDVICKVFEQLTQPLLKQLEKESRGVLQVTCTVEVSRYGQRIYSEFEDARQDTEILTLGLYRPTTDLKHLSELFHLQWDRLGRVDEVYSCRVEFTQTATMQQKQLSLFDRQSNAQKKYRWQSTANSFDRIPPAKLVRLIDRLSSRLGKKRVLRATLKPQALPEYGFQLEPIANLNVQRWCRQILVPQKNSPSKSGNVFPRSTRTRKTGWLLKQCKPVDSLPIWYWKEPFEIQCQICRKENRPLKMLHKGHWRQITRYWGPERIESGWWRGRAIRRDYYRVELETGLRFWLYRGLPGEHWFLQGNF
jgi:protein ImuB